MIWVHFAELMEYKCWREWQAAETMLLAFMKSHAPARCGEWNWLAATPAATGRARQEKYESESKSEEQKEGRSKQKQQHSGRKVCTSLLSASLVSVACVVVGDGGGSSSVHNTRQRQTRTAVLRHYSHVCV